MFIDATGDAMLAALSGARCREAGRDTPGIMPPTLCALCAGIDWNRATKPGGLSPTDQQKLLEKAIADGFFAEPDRHLPGLLRVGHTVGMLNTAHVFHVNALQCRSLSDGVIKGRKRVQEYIEFYIAKDDDPRNVEIAHRLSHGLRTTVMDGTRQRQFDGTRRKRSGRGDSVTSAVVIRLSRRSILQ